MEKEVFIEKIEAGSKLETFSGTATNAKGEASWAFTNLPIFKNGQPLKEPSECPPPSLISVTLDGRNPVSAELIVFAEGENWDNLEDDTKKTYRAATGKTNKDMNAKGISIKRI